MDRILPAVCLTMLAVFSTKNLPAESDITAGVLIVSLDREMITQLAIADERLSRHEFAAAETILAELWRRTDAQLIGSPDSLETAAQQIIRRIERLPDSRQADFWQRTIATTAGDSPRRFDLPTRDGYLAWRTEATRRRDRGEFMAAVAAFRRAARHPGASEQERLECEIFAIDLQANVDGPVIVDNWLSRQPERLRNKTILIAGQAVNIGEWLRRKRTRTAVPQLVTDRPSSMTVWKRPLIHDQAVAAGWRTAADELREQGLIRIPAARPLVIDNKVVVHIPEGMACLSTTSGEILWTSERKSSRDRLNLAGKPPNPFFSAKLLASLARQFQTNSLIGDLSHDDRYIYHVIEADAPTDPAATGSTSGLDCVDHTNGQVQWRIGNVKAGNGETVLSPDWASQPDFLVCAAPLVLDGMLHLLCMVKSELRLNCFDRESLALRWSCPLGDLLPDASRVSPQKYAAARLVWTGELITCVTNCGVICGVDPIRQRVQWMNRFPVEIRAASRLDPSGADPAMSSMLASWRQAELYHVDGKLVAASPETSSLHLIAAATGKTHWRIPRDHAISLLGVTKAAVFLLESNAVRAHDLLTGRELWRAVTGEVQGRGVISKQHLIQPLADGSTAVLKLQTGQRIPSSIRSSTSWGQLTQLPDGWLNFHEISISKHYDVATTRHSDNNTRMVLEAGDFPAIRKTLADQAGETAQVSQLEADYADLEFSPVNHQEVWERWQAQTIRREDRVELLWRLANAAGRTKDWKNVTDYCLIGLNLDATETRIISDKTTRCVRVDRAFQGKLAEAWTSAGAAEQKYLADRLAASWTDTQHRAEPFGLQQLEHRWRMIPWTRQPALEASESIFLGINLSGREAWLRSLTQNLGTLNGRHASWKLRDEWQTAGFNRDAHDLDYRLLRSIPGQVIGDLTVRQRLQKDPVDMAALHRRLNFGPNEGWPSESPRVTPGPSPTADVLQTPLPIHAEADSIWDRVDVTVDRQGLKLRFTGDRHAGSWSAAVPKGTTPLQQYPLTYQGWGLGRRLIVRIGTLLLSVRPWNEQGEPEAVVDWSLDLVGPSSQTQEQLVVERQVSTWKQAQEHFRILDPFGHDVAFVGPVHDGYLCYMQRGKLIALETQTGQKLWERWDVSPGTVPLGDDSKIALWSPDIRRCEILDVTDGRTLDVQHCQLKREDVWHQSGCRIWSGITGEELEFFAMDLTSQNRLWSRTFPKNSLPMNLDGATGAVIDPRGLLHLIDLETGHIVDEPLTIDLPLSIERFMVNRDEYRWYLGISGPVERSFEWVAAQPLNGFRRPLLQGTLLAIDRHQRQIVWKRELSGEPWPLDQPRSSPVLVQVYKQPPPGGQGVGDGVVRLIDQRTGQDVLNHRDLNQLAYFSLESWAEFQKFSLHTNTATFDIHYAPNTD